MSGLQGGIHGKRDRSPMVPADIYGGAAKRLEPFGPAVSSITKNEAAERASQRDRPETLNTSSRPISLDDRRRWCRSAREQGDSP